MKEQDCIRRFIFEKLGIRGEWVSLQQSWQETKQHQGLSESIEEQLGQAMAATVMLAETIKFEGSLILQAQGSSALKAIVAQVTHDRKIRGIARSNESVPAGGLSEMMGEGRLVITVEPEHGEPYQGIVPLEGNTFSDVINTYFLQSEQLETCVWLFANKEYAAGLLLQRLPSQEDYKADWERITLLANTVTKDEMLALNCEQMLYRLFNEESVRVFDADTVNFSCACSRKKIEKTLIALGRQELDNILQERGVIDVDCEFCRQHFSFDTIDVESLFAGQAVDNISKRQH